MRNLRQQENAIPILVVWLEGFMLCETDNELTCGQAVAFF